MSQLAEIVDLTIEAQYVAIASVHHRLMTAWTEINDAKPVVADSKTGGHGKNSFSIVRAPMGHRSHHPIKRRLIPPDFRIYHPTPHCTHSVKQPFEARCATLIGGRMT